MEIYDLEMGMLIDKGDIMGSQWRDTGDISWTYHGNIMKYNGINMKHPHTPWWIYGMKPHRLEGGFQYERRMDW